ncbi:hypothetical protein A9Q84_14975 [Halobacteriovorax marinus]|uniref:HTH lysR-type domain-containing protein n=1 Tax=Halobacteriovorax marinus TaxID=97084 RepID=A0A1Y5F566_9BACT|nr:hypothetical protein A9Q84_14975 [Halobacteriovorax marinus]
MKKDFDKLRALKLFINIVEEGSFSMAAKKMAMTPSSASKEMTTLEESLGVKLLYRTTRKVGLTDDGRVYLEGVQRIIIDLDLLDDTLLKRKLSTRGNLKITSPSVWGHVVLSPIVAKYKMKFPEVTIEMDLSNRIVDIVGESFDIAIRSTALVDSTFYAIKLKDEDETVCVSKKYLKKFGTPRRAKDLIQHNCLTLSVGSISLSSWKFKENGKVQTINVSGNVKANDMHVLHHNVLAGVGIGKIPRYLIEGDIKKGRLVTLFEDKTSNEKSFYAFYRQKRSHSPIVDSFLTFLEEHIEELR